MFLPTLVLTSLLTRQNGPVPIDYSVQLGASSEFHKLVIDIKASLASKQFAAAEAQARLLPKSSLTFYIDTKNLDDFQKEDFPSTMRNAIMNWERMGSKLFTLNEVKSKNADLVFGFEPVLAALPGTNLVPGGTWFFGDGKEGPMMEAIIGLKRGTKLEKAQSRDVYNETIFTIGRYFGLAPTPLFGSAMGRYEERAPRNVEITPAEVTVVRKNLELAHNLRQAIKDRKQIAVGNPSIVLEKKSFEFETKFQGDEGRATMLLTNNGTAPLQLRVQGDCGCITGSIVPILEPGKTALLTGIYNTSEISGEIHHNLVLRTNDPDRPSIVIPCAIKVNPRAEFIYPESSTIYLDGTQKSFVFYMNTMEDKSFSIINSGIIGGDFTLKTEPFEGDVPNFATPGVKKHVRGHKVTIDTTKYQAEALFGRSIAMVNFRTSHPSLPIIRTSLNLQRGIVALPETIYLGTPRGPIDSTFVVTRPGRPFQIKKITCGSPNITFEIIPTVGMSGSDYLVKMFYDGKASGHLINTTMTITTSDPKQPTIRVPIQTSGA